MVGWEEFIYKVSRTGMTSDFINTVEKKIKQCFHKFEEKILTECFRSQLNRHYSFKGHEFE